MKTQNPALAGAIRFAMRGAIGLSTVLAAHAALAQDTGDKLEEIYVTGSRIARASDFDSPSPVVTFSQEELAKTGYTNLQQLMEKQPFAGNGTFSTRGNNQDSTANGASAISLRGLGADATLVLVNGRRVAISAFAESITTNFVDVNTIPVAAIERVEVLKDGASAVYGSDAVAGVVNIVLRKNFEGIEVSAGYGATTESGMDETSVSAIWGLGGDDANVTMILDYFNNSTLENTERGYLGTANQEPRGGVDNRSSRGFPGSFLVYNPDLLPEPGYERNVDPACPPERTTGSQRCVYDYGPWNLLEPEAERLGFMLLGHTGIGAGIELFTEIGVQHNTSIAQGAPTPLDETALLTVPADHPDNPFDTDQVIQIDRFRTVDAGARTWHIETDNLRGVLGLRGEIADWNWEVSAQRARSETEQTGDRSDGWVRTDFLQTEINAGRYNPFGGTYNPRSVIDAITTSLVRQGKSDLTMYDAQLTGDLFELPAGTIAMAAGLEYREESIKDIPDDQFQRGLIFGTEAVTAAASRDIWSAYVEFSVPVIESLELDLALRYDDYSDFGSTTNPKVALRWAPIDTLALRASWGTGFRAPSLAQIGLGPSQESQFFKDTYLCIDQGIDPDTDACEQLDYNILFSGNPDLDAEESESYNFGVAWQPLDSLRLSIDYWDIKQENKIDEYPFGFVYTQNCNDQDSAVCVRGEPLPGDTLGPLQLISTSFTNIGEQSVSGVDLGVYFDTALGGGTLGLALDYSRLLDFERVELNSAGDRFVTRDLAGEYEYPEDRFVLSGDWALTNWGFSAAVNYIGKFEDAPDADFDGTLDYDTVKTRSVDAFVTLNLQARYTGFEGVTLSLGIENALDEDPPFAIGDGDTDLYGYVSSQHDPRGRFVYGKAVYRF